MTTHKSPVVEDATTTSRQNEQEQQQQQQQQNRNHPVKWYRSTFYNMTILGLCNLSAPGIWSAMNSLGAGGSASPQLVNTSNALTFSLMVLSCLLSGVFVHYLGIKGALVFGTIGYAPYAAGLYLESRYSVPWLTVLGAALCGISAGVFWMAEASVAIAYPEPWNRGKALGYWLTYRLMGQILGGAINLGLNADRSSAGQVTYTVYLLFIAIQACGPFVALLLNKPGKVMRKDGKAVKLAVEGNPWGEVGRTARFFVKPGFLLLVLWIGQAVFSEAVFFTYLSTWFSVRARALGSFLAGIVAMIVGNLLGLLLDRPNLSLKRRSRLGFAMIATCQGAWWVWAVVMVTRFRAAAQHPTYDWETAGFGAAFGVYIFLAIGMQANYLFLYFIITNLAKSEVEVIRYSALLRGTESAWQAISYGLTSITLFAEVGAIYMCFGIWACSIFPAWLVLRHFGQNGEGEEEKEEEEGKKNGGSSEEGTNSGPEMTVTTTGDDESSRNKRV